MGLANSRVDQALHFLMQKQTHLQTENIIQWNPSITATIGEQHDGRYTGVAVVEGFCVLNVQMSILNT